MKKTTMATKTISIFLMFLLIGASYANTDPSTAQEWANRETTAFGLEENKGQVTGDDAHKVKYFHNSGGVSVFLMSNGLAYQFTKMHYPEGYKPTEKGSSSEEMEQMDKLSKQIRMETYRMDVRLVGANPNPKISTTGKSKDYIQYYNHNVLDVHGYQKVTYHNVYPNIDWVIYKDGENLKYDFVVHPGGNPALIKLQTKWVENAKLNKDGSLTLSNRMGEITEKTPVSFQGEREIKTAFVLNNDIIQFQLGDYDKTKTLVIDPLVWGTAYGGPNNDHAWSVATDLSGNVFMSGTTLSGLLIASGGHQNAFAGDEDAFLVKFNSSGVRLWATYYGGVNQELGRQCATDSQGNIYLGGSTTSSSNISFNGHQNGNSGSRDAFLVKFDANGIRLWATYYGGTQIDNGFGVCVDPSDNVYLVGDTRSTNNISFNGHQNTFGGGIVDVFIVKFDANGTRLWGSYYGGFGSDKTASCTTDQLGNVYLSGNTRSGNFGNAIAFNGFQQIIGGGESTVYDDAFLVKFDPNGTRLWSTYFGGSHDEDGVGGFWFGHGSSAAAANSCMTDSQNNVYLVGATQSNNLPIFGGHQTSHGGGARDAYLVKIDPNGAYLWGTYFGGTFEEYAFGCVDANDNVFIAGVAVDNNVFYTKFLSNGNLDFTHTFPTGNASVIGCTAGDNGTIYIVGSMNNPQELVLNGHQMQVNGMFDGFLAKVSGNNCSPATSTINHTVCSSYTWADGDGNTYTSSTTATHTIVGGAANGCDSTITLNLTINQPTSSSVSVTECEEYTWAVNNQTYTSSGTHTHVIPNANNCDSTITLNLTINQPTSSSVSVTECEEYTWAVNNQTYTSSGTHTYVIPNANNCDSTITLNLTITQPTSSSETITECGEYTWAVNNQTYTSSGTHTHIIPNANNCDSTITLNLTINNVDNTVSVSGIELTANQTGATYQWVDCDNGNTPISGETAQSFEPTANGNYAVEVTANGCTETSNCVVVNSVGINKIWDTEFVEVFPNPSSGLFTIKGESLNKNTIIKVMNALGQELNSKTMISNGVITIDLTSEAPGVYLLNINDETSKRIIQLIKKQ